MKLINLKIEKFRKLENLEFDFEDGINLISGDNGIGKTSILDSILWLLADETLIYGSTNSENLDKNNPREQLAVEGLFMKDKNQALLTLRREFKPKFNKEGEFTDYSNKFYINNAEYSVKEYKGRLYQEIGLNTELITKGFNDIRALCDFDYFGSIDYKIAREKIETILDISSDENLINEEKYEIIRNDLKALLFDVSKAKTLFNKEKKNAELECVKYETLIQEIDKLPQTDTKRVGEIQKEIEALENNQFKHSEDYQKAIDEIAKAREERQNYESQLIEKSKSFDILEAQNNNLVKTIEAYKVQFENDKLKFLTLKDSINKCPKCGYELNGDTIKAQLLEIQKELKDIQEKANAISKNEVFAKYKVAQEDFENFRKEYADKDDEYNKLVNYYNELINAEDEKEKQYNILKAQKISTLQGELKALTSRSNDTNKLEVFKSSYDKAKEEMSKNELKLQLLEEYKQAKIDYVQKQVANVFPNIDFILVEISNSGAISQTCKATYKGVDYLGLNDGQKIKLGIEIIEHLRKALKVTEVLPIFVNKLSDLSNKNKIGLLELTKAQLFCTFPTDDENISIKNIKQ